MLETIEKPSAVEAHSKIESFAPVKDARFVDTMTVGQFVRQGDVYIVKIKSVARGLKETKNRQLAPGSTQGSRHTVDGNVTVFEPKLPNQRRESNGGVAIVGPQIESKDHFTIAHPEHADISLPPGAYECLYQFDHATGKRVAD